MLNQIASTVRNPEINELAARDELLQLCLRDPSEFDVAFPIRAEYPLVLSPEARLYSHLAFSDHKPVAHINALPRKVVNQDGEHQFNILLVGNVCTHPQFRGRGLIRTLIEKIELQYSNCSAIFLWSDLDQFYQKLGFTSLKQENRYFLNRNSSASSLVKTENPVNILKTSDINFDLSNLEPLRPDSRLRLARSQEELRTVLSIPETYFVYLGEAANPQSYGFIGKGVDLQGVIHEWGARTQESMLNLIDGLLQIFSLDQVILLAPSSLDSNWHEALQLRSEKVELHTMALAKCLGNFEGQRLNELFIWGLDSI